MRDSVKPMARSCPESCRRSIISGTSGDHGQKCPGANASGFVNSHRHLSRRRYRSAHGDMTTDRRDGLFASASAGGNAGVGGNISVLPSSPCVRTLRRLPPAVRQESDSWPGILFLPLNPDYRRIHRDPSRGSTASIRPGRPRRPHDFCRGFTPVRVPIAWS